MICEKARPRQCFLIINELNYGASPYSVQLLPVLFGKTIPLFIMDNKHVGTPCQIFLFLLSIVAIFLISHVKSANGLLNLPFSPGWGRFEIYFYQINKSHILNYKYYKVISNFWKVISIDDTKKDGQQLLICSLFLFFRH